MSLRRALNATTTRRIGFAPARGLSGFDATFYGSPLTWLSGRHVTGLNQTPAHGAAITSWYDATGNLRTMFPQIGTITYDSAGHLNFTAGRMTGTSFNKPDDHTLYVLLRKTVSTAVGFVSADGSPPRWWQFQADANGAVKYQPFIGTSTVQTELVSAASVNLANVWYALTVHRSAARGTIVRQNSTQIMIDAASIPGVNPTIRPLIVGGNYDGIGTFTGQVAQVIMYPVGHSDAEMTAVETALLASLPV